MSQYQNDIVSQRAAAYLRWRDEFMADPDNRAIYDVEAANSEWWLQLFSAREAAGVTRAELAQRLGVSERRVVQIEKDIAVHSNSCADMLRH